MPVISKTDCCADRSTLTLLSVYQEYLVAFYLMTSQVVQRERPLGSRIWSLGRERVLTKQVSPCVLRGSLAYIVLCVYGCNVLSGFVQKVSSHGNLFNLVSRRHFLLQPQGRQRRKNLGTMVFCAVFIDFRGLYICFFQMKRDSKYLLTKRADYCSIYYSLSDLHNLTTQPITVAVPRVF